MSIKPLIEQISVLGENVSSLLEIHCGINILYRPNNPFGAPPFDLWKQFGLQWTEENDSVIVRLSLQDEKINDLDQYLYDKGFAPPRLSSEDIQALTTRYPYQLPTEVQTLYQCGNGCFPKTRAKDRPLSFSSYFYSFFDSDYGFDYLPLKEAMTNYLSMQEMGSSNPKIFPLAQGLDRWTMGIEGSEEAQDSSPLYSYYCDDAKIRLTLQWPNLVSQLSAAIELTEKKLRLGDSDDQETCQTILSQYGNTNLLR